MQCTYLPPTYYLLPTYYLPTTTYLLPTYCLPLPTYPPTTYYYLLLPTTSPPIPSPLSKVVFFDFIGSPVSYLFLPFLIFSDFLELSRESRVTLLGTRL